MVPPTHAIFDVINHYDLFANFDVSYNDQA